MIFRWGSPGVGSELDISIQEVYWGDALGLIVVEGKEKKQIWQREKRSLVVMQLQQRPKAIPRGPLKLDGLSE